MEVQAWFYEVNIQIEGLKSGGMYFGNAAFAVGHQGQLYGTPVHALAEAVLDDWYRARTRKIAFRIRVCGDFPMGRSSDRLSAGPQLPTTLLKISYFPGGR